MSLSDLARERGWSKQAIYKNLQRWAEAGRVVATRKEGRALLVKVAEYDSARGEIGDVAKQTGEATKKGLAHDSGVPLLDPIEPVYTREQARAKQYEADIKEIELAKLRGELIEVMQLRDAATVAAESMLRAIDQLPSRAEELANATKMPIAQCRQFLKASARDLRQRATDVFASLAANAVAGSNQAEDDED